MTYKHITSTGISDLGLQVRFDMLIITPCNKLATVAQLDVAWHRTAADVSIAAHRWNVRGRGQEALVLGTELQSTSTVGFETPRLCARPFGTRSRLLGGVPAS